MESLQKCRSICLFGRYNLNNRSIYNLVLEMNRTVEKVLKQGIAWLDMQKLAERVLLKGLIKLNILHGDIEEMMEKRVPYLFMPHGLGHFLVTRPA